MLFRLPYIDFLDLGITSGACADGVYLRCDYPLTCHHNLSLNPGLLPETARSACHLQTSLGSPRQTSWHGGCRVAPEPGWSSAPARIWPAPCDTPQPRDPRRRGQTTPSPPTSPLWSDQWTAAASVWMEALDCQVERGLLLTGRWTISPPSLGQFQMESWRVWTRWKVTLSKCL